MAAGIMKSKLPIEPPEVVTVGEARSLTGPGLSIIWRPDGYPTKPKRPDADVAFIVRRPHQ